MSSIPEAVHEMLQEERTDIDAMTRAEAPPDAEWRKLRELGTRLWLDTGDVEEAGRLWNSSFEALTTNNTLLNKEVQKGLYDDLMHKAAEAVRRADPTVDQRRLVLEVAFLLNAYHGLKLARCFDAHVSVELHTDLANDIGRTVEYGKRFFSICPERFYVKVPMTPAGFLGARKLGQAGVPVNFTLGFSARQNYLAALVSNPSFVNVFMGRVNAFVADNELGDGTNMGEKATLAAQRELLDLRAADRSQSLLIGASMRDGGQVASLAGLDVYTMPPKAAAAYRENPADRLASRTSDDPDVAFVPGVRLEDFGGDVLWDVTPSFKECVERLLEKDPDAISPEELRKHFETGGFADFLPEWSDEELRTATDDGKIPAYKSWRDKLQAGAVGIDALLNMSALRSFATDQEALDARIRAHI